MTEKDPEKEYDKISETTPFNRGPLSAVVISSPNSSSARRSTLGSPTWRDVIPQVWFSCISHLLVVHAGANMAFCTIMLTQMAEMDIKVSQESASWITSAVAIATPVGALLAGPLMDWRGRRETCKFTAILAAISWALVPNSNATWLIYLSRVLAGLAGGLSTSAIMYVTEISDPNIRAMLLSLNSVFVSLGIVIIAILGLWLKWREIAYFFMVLAAVNYLLLILVPESPHWLLNMSPEKSEELKQQKVEQSVAKLSNSESYFEANLQKLLDSRPSVSNQEPTKWHLYFKERSSLRPLLLLCNLFVVQQLSGVYVIIFYAVPLFKLIEGSFHQIDAFSMMAIMSGIRFVMSIVTAGLSMHLGRRILLMASFLGMSGFAFLAATTIGKPVPEFGIQNSTQNMTEEDQVFHHPQLQDSLQAVIYVLCLVLASSLGVLVVPWTLIGELLPLKSRASGGGFMVCFAYLLMFIIVKSFPYTVDSWGISGTFYFFSVICLTGFIFVFLYIPETLGRSFKDVEDFFSSGRKLAININCCAKVRGERME